MGKIKYILINPKVVLEDVEKNGFYGANRCISRLNYGNPDPEHNVSYLYFNECKEAIKRNINQADITEAFNYSGYGLEPRKIRSQLAKVFLINEIIDSDENGKTIYVEYIPNAQYEKIKNDEDKMHEIAVKYNELEESLQPLIEYDEQSKRELASNILQKYSEDLSQRGDVVFQIKKDSQDKDKKWLGGGMHVYPQQLTYYCNNEKWIVALDILFDDKAYMSLSDFGRSNDIISIFIDLYRESENGQIECVTRCIKSCSSNEKNALIISCYFGEYLYYDNINNKEYFVRTEKPYSGSIRKVNKEEFDEVTRMMIDPRVIEKIYDLINSKIKLTLFDETNSDTKKAGEYELGSWPQNEIELDFDEMVNGQKKGDVR